MLKNSFSSSLAKLEAGNELATFPAWVNTNFNSILAFYVVISGLLTEVYVGIFEEENDDSVDFDSIQKRLVLFLGVFVVYPLGVLRELSAIG